MTSVFRIVKLLLLLGVLCLAGGWAILAMPLFSDLRRPFLEDLLSEQIGQPLYIKEDVRITLGATSHIHAGTVQIPSETIPELILAELNVFELDLNLLALMKGKVDIDNLVVDGLNVRMSTQEDGTQSWATENGQELELPSFGRSKEDAELQATDRDGILEFLSDKTASFTSVRWIVDNRVTGFKFDFDLNDARLEQIGDAGGITATSKGSVNGQDFTIKGNYPKGEAFTTATTFGDVKLDFDGMPIDEQQGGGFTGKLSLNTGEIGDFLEVLRLDRDFEGQAELAADLHHQKGQLKATNIKTDIDLSSGSKITANGKIDNLLTATGIDLDFIGRLYPEGKPPSPTNDLKDLRLADLSTQLVSTEGALEFQDLILTTNAFDENFSRLGPVNIGKVFRGDEGNLMFENISLQAGPQDAPFITAEGNIKDLLRLKDIDFDGTFSVPAS
ncbi:MAG: AsmA family protein, partial [Hyphomicrobiales bacterium]